MLYCISFRKIQTGVYSKLEEWLLCQRSKGQYAVTKVTLKGLKMSTLMSSTSLERIQMETRLLKVSIESMHSIGADGHQRNPVVKGIVSGLPS